MNTYQVVCYDTEIHSCFWVALVARYAQHLHRLMIVQEEGRDAYLVMTFVENKYSETFRQAAEMKPDEEYDWKYGNGV